MDFIMGGIIQFGGKFAPRDWAFCDGQLIAISQNQALYAILGLNFGGDARTNFALPDLRGRAPIGVGQGPGLMPWRQAMQFGSEQNQLVESQLPAHTHAASFTGTGGGTHNLSATTSTAMKVTAEPGDTNDPTDAYIALAMDGKNPINIYKKTTNSSNTINSDAISSTTTIEGNAVGITGGTVTVYPTGNNQSINNIQPSLGMNFIIALEGIFPARN